MEVSAAVVERIRTSSLLLTISRVTAIVKSMSTCAFDEKDILREKFRFFVTTVTVLRVIGECVPTR